MIGTLFRRSDKPYVYSFGKDYTKMCNIKDKEGRTSGFTGLSMKHTALKDQ